MRSPRTDLLRKIFPKMKGLKCIMLEASVTYLSVGILEGETTGKINGGPPL